MSSGGLFNERVVNVKLSGTKEGLVVMSAPVGDLSFESGRYAAGKSRTLSNSVTRCPSSFYNTRHCSLLFSLAIMLASFLPRSSSC